MELQRQIGRFYCGLQPAEVMALAARAKRAVLDRQSTMTPKNARRLRALADPTNRAALLHLPQHLMRLAEEAGAGTKAAARLAMSAVADEILLMCPLRIGNLQKLRPKDNLLRLGAGGRHITHLFIRLEDVRYDEGVEWPLPPCTAKLIETYLTRFRPAIAAPRKRLPVPWHWTGGALNRRRAVDLV